MAIGSTTASTVGCGHHAMYRLGGHRIVMAHGHT